MGLAKIYGPSGPIRSLSRDVRQSCVCVSVCAVAETRFPVDWRHLVKENIANIGRPLDVFGFYWFNDFLRFEFVAVGVSDR